MEPGLTGLGQLVFSSQWQHLVGGGGSLVCSGLELLRVIISAMSWSNIPGDITPLHILTWDLIARLSDRESDVVTVTEISWPRLDCRHHLPLRWRELGNA